MTFTKECETLSQSMLRWLWVLLVACGTSKSDRDRDRIASTPPAATSPTAKPARAAVLAEPDVPLPRELAFEVVDAGAKERSALRYTLAAGSSKLVVRTALSSRELVDGAWRGPTRLPAITTELEASIGRDGRVALRPLPQAADGGGPAAAAGAGYLEPWQALVGRSFELAIDARGRVDGVVGHDASWDELIQRLFATVVPLPDEPIAEGARWRVVTALRQQQAVLKQTATYTLVSRRMPWEIAIDIQRLAERQVIGDVELVAIVRRLRGTVAIDPARPWPVRGTLTVESTVHVRSGSREHIVEDTGTVELSSTSSTAR